MTLIDRFIRSLLLRHKNRGTLGSADSRRDFLRTMVMGGILAPVVPGFVERIVVLTGRYRSNADLLRAMGRGDQAAMDAFAAFMTAPILQVIEQAPVFSNLLATEPHSLDSTPQITIPLTYAWGPSVKLSPRAPREEVVYPVHNTWCHGRGRSRDPWDIS